VLLALLGVTGVTSCAGGLDGYLGPPAAPAAPPVAVEPADAAAAGQQLSRLPVAEERRGGYQRTRDFGPAWSFDYDHNGCRQRDDVLRRDLTRIATQGRCTVISGVLADPYTGRTITFRKQSAADVQIDHLYPLAAAWAHGARSWPQSRRISFANDPANLVASSGTANQSKGDSTPAEWQPQGGYRCAYAVRYVGVAARYGLSISAADRRALSSMLSACPK
jgi:hypothetical protein